ncbi:MAG TPA: hypothetical protein VGI33_11580 [Paenibacillus sp.]
MENEEGMNHLWIQFFWDDTFVPINAEIRVQLPNGVYRLHNLNGYDENEFRHILLDLSKDKDVLIEFFTQDAITCGEAIIIVTLSSGDYEQIQEIPIHLVSDQEMDLLDIDEHVIERLKELANSNDSSTKKETDLVVIQPRILEIRSNESSYLEKEYRVDY